MINESSATCCTPKTMLTMLGFFLIICLNIHGGHGAGSLERSSLTIPNSMELGPSRSSSTYDLWTNSVAANHGSRLALMCHRPSADSGARARALVVLSPRKRRGHTGYTSRLALSLSAYYHLRVESICFFPFFICVISSKNPKRRYCCKSMLIFSLKIISVFRKSKFH